MGTTLVFLDPYFALRTPAHVICQREASKCALLPIVALTAFMPMLLALEARKVATMRT